MAASSYDQKRSSMFPDMASHSSWTPNNRASTRLSTYSMTPTLAPSIAPSRLSCAPSEMHSDAQSDHATISLTPSEKASPLAQDIRTFTSGLARLDQPKLQNQRYTVSEGKKADMSKLALGAKLERALGRRMSSQDAIFTKKTKCMDHIGRSISAYGEKDVVV